MNPKNVIMTTIHKYSYDQVETFIRSIDASRIDAMRVAVIYELEDDVVNRLKDDGFMVFKYELFGHVAEQRFSDMVAVIEMLSQSVPINRVLIVDSRDLVFQSDPFKWIESNGDPDLILSDEGVTHADEPWNKATMTRCYGEYICSLLADKNVINAGVIAGSIEKVRDLLVSIVMYDMASPATPSDQSALNMIAHSSLSRSSYMLAGDGDAWAAQLHVKVARQDELRIKNGYQLVNEKDVPYCIVHQYDRSEMLTKLISETYK